MKTETRTFDVQKACEAQTKFVKEHDYPYFAPGNGVCYSCRRNIYREEKNGNYSSGITVEKASSELITGCPHCHYSYCE